MSIKARLVGFAFAVCLMMAAGCLVAGCASGGGDAASSAEASEATSSAAVSTSAASGSLADAEALIGQEMTMEEVEAALGPAKNFNMSAEGCERGVMQGIFYYEGYSVYSRTYNKGQTFKIVSVSD